jgi:hypothetical protein
MTDENGVTTVGRRRSREPRNANLSGIRFPMNIGH